MKQLLQSCCIAFSMYSAISSPQVDWNQDTMKYAMCFFPLVGVAVGAVMILWLWICQTLAIGTVLRSAVALCIPLLITGGIHVDGFCDTVDALSSHAEQQRKLEILKDSHIGAFALIGCLVYFFLNFGFWNEFIIQPQTMLLLGLGYVFSRSLSGLSIVQFACAKNSGLAKTFADGAAKQKVKKVMYVYLFLCALLFLLIQWQLGLAMLIAGFGVFFYYYVMSKKQFGGITGDLAGYFLQLCELVLLLVLVIGGNVLW